jgi:hypothetical protein
VRADRRDRTAASRARSATTGDRHGEAPVVREASCAAWVLDRVGEDFDSRTGVSGANVKVTCNETVASVAAAAGRTARDGRGANGVRTDGRLGFKRRQKCRAISI